jgi:Raf kinase inhibitor-like YbhB/YbcL family protein
MIKNILLLLFILITGAFVIRLIQVSKQQRAEFNYHKSIPQTIALSSDDFVHDEMMPTPFSGKSDNKSPELHWGNLPTGTKSLVLLMTDYDGPAPYFKLTTVSHWVLYNIPAQVHTLPQAITVKQLQADHIISGVNYTGGIDYAGPKPPIGVHRYFFRVYALSVPTLDLANPGKQEVLEAMEGKILAYGELVGKF